MLNLLIEKKPNEPTFDEFEKTWRGFGAEIIYASDVKSNGCLIADGLDNPPYFVYGSINLCTLMHLHEKCIVVESNLYTHRGQSSLFLDNLLNYDGVIFKVKDLPVISGEPDYFIKPNLGKKEFIPGIYTLSEMERLFKDRDLFFGNENTEVVLASPKEISYETRLWFVGGNLITGSRYREHGKMVLREGTIPGITREMSKLLDHALPDFTGVVDICALVGSDRQYVVEVNRINSSALYKTNQGAIVEALIHHF